VHSAVDFAFAHVAHCSVAETIAGLPGWGTLSSEAN
jgi:hypothetical protein